jgi:hypothetical protein
MSKNNQRASRNRSKFYSIKWLKSTLKKWLWGCGFGCQKTSICVENAPQNRHCVSTLQPVPEKSLFHWKRVDLLGENGPPKVKKVTKSTLKKVTFHGKHGVWGGSVKIAKVKHQKFDMGFNPKSAVRSKPTEKSQVVQRGLFFLRNQHTIFYYRPLDSTPPHFFNSWFRTLFWCLCKWVFFKCVLLMCFWCIFDDK